jgi:hypothetical protein
MYKIIGADQKEYGPITADQLRQWISEGRINASTKVQPEGTMGWKSVSELPEFAAALPVVAPPPSRPPAPMAMATPPPAKSNKVALWAMITGIIELLCCCQILGPVSIVLGVVALSQIKANPPQEGRGFAIAGIIMGVLALILLIVSIVFFSAFPQYLTNFQNSLPH